MRLIAPLSVLILGITLFGCHNHSGNWSLLNLSHVDGNQVDLKPLSEQSTVFVFLSPECPLCQNYSVKLGSLISQHQSDSLRFVGIFSGKFYSVPEIKKYLIKYKLTELTALLDPDLSLAKQLGATITPEVVLTQNTEILYRGAIDDWAIDLGQKRLKANHHYLQDAIEAHWQNEEINPSRTAAVGCFIE